MTSRQLKYGQLSYEVFGSGDRILFAFHGFGQNKTFFQGWEKSLGKDYTIYAVDLFYHGSSQRPIKKLTRAEWKLHFEKLLHAHQIKKFSVLGYSLGGRFAIASALLFPNMTEEITLIAPDGIFLTIWFKLATTPIIRQLFKFGVSRPELLEKWLRFNEKTRLIGSYVSDFVRKEMGSHENRRRVYISWNSFKHLGYKEKELESEFTKHNFKKNIVLGSKDFIIKPSGILPIIEKMGNFNVRIFEKKHHQLLDDEIMNWFATLNTSDEKAPTNS